MGVKSADMADRHDNSFRIRPGRPKNRGAGASLYSKPFITQVKIAVRKAGGNPDRIGGESGQGSEAGVQNSRRRFRKTVAAGRAMAAAHGSGRGVSSSRRG